MQYFSATPARRRSFEFFTSESLLRQAVSLVLAWAMVMTSMPAYAADWSHAEWVKGLGPLASPMTPEPSAALPPVPASMARDQKSIRPVVRPASSPLAALHRPALFGPPAEMAAPLLPPFQLGSSSSLQVSVGFADNSSASANFPEPWNESNPLVQFAGAGTAYRAGAVRLDNSTAIDVVVDSVTVDLGRPGPVFQLWNNITVPAFGSAILTQTADGNFNTSGSPIVGCGAELAANETRIPKVTVTVGGTATDFSDTAHVLDTGGFNSSCRGNQSLGWRPIGTTGMEAPAASIQLIADQAPHAVGTQNEMTIQAGDAAGQPLANAPVGLQVVNGPNVGRVFNAVTDATGSASVQYSSSLQGADLLQAVMSNSTGGALQSQQVATTWTSADACSAPATPDAAATRLIYVGQTTTTFGNALRLAALLTDGTGTPLSNRPISFLFGAQTVTANTDSNGVATTLASLEVGQTGVTVSFAGESGYQPVQLSTTVSVLRAATLLRYTGTNLIASLGSQTVSALLTDSHGKTPVAGRTINFTLNNITITAVTDASGSAIASFNFQPEQPSGPSQLQISFAGDASYLPSTRTARVQIYEVMPFVVWGGNSGGLKIGNRVNFWGDQWSKQVTGGFFTATASFKGWGGSVPSLQQCQANATPATLTPDCWQVKPGQSFPPTITLPAFIEVVISTVINKSGNTVFGNIACGAIVQVDHTPPYGAVPGQPGFGNIVAVNGDCAGVFPQPAKLVAAQQQPNPVLPGQQITVDYNIANQGATDATSVVLNENFDQLTPATGSANLGTIVAGGSASGNFPVAVPSIDGRQPAESSVDYQSRLAAFDGRLFTSEGEITFTDPFSQIYTPVEISSFSQLNLPRLSIGLSGLSCIAPGTTVPYQARIDNLGSATAEKIAASVTLPDNTATPLTVPDLPSGMSFAGTVNWKSPGVAAKGAGESTADYLTRLQSVDGVVLPPAVASATWQDHLANNYGPVEQPFASLTQRVPIVSVVTPASQALLPNQKTQLSFPTSNIGTGNAVQITLQVKKPDGSLLTLPNFSLPGGQSATVNSDFTVAAPQGGTAKGANEADGDYVTRLLALNGSTLDFDAILNWTDSASNHYGPTDNPFSATETLPVLQLGASATPSSVLPGQTATLSAVVNNAGSSDAQKTALTITRPDGSIAAPAPYTLAAGQSNTSTENFGVPAVAARGAGETDSAYLARLQSFDNKALSFNSSLNWSDAVANSYGRLSSRAQVTEQLPVISIALSAPANANAGGTITYTATLTNSGHAAATIGNLAITMPDGSVQHPSVANSTLAPGLTTTATASFAIPSSQPTGVISASVSVAWADAVPNSYGPVSASASTSVTQPNKPPVVNAGPNQTTTLPNATVTLNGTATDDGLPVGILNVNWSQVSGPAAVIFGSPATAVTQATFSAAGVYVLRLTASDTQLSSSADVTVTVNSTNQAPVVNAGAGGAVTLFSPFTLHGSVTDDGLPAGKLIIQWTQVSGPSTAVFADATLPVTTVSFDSPGTYILRLTASDTQLSSSADTTVVALISTGSGNQPPFVEAGPDQIIALPNPAVLNGLAFDDGLPDGTLQIAWSKVSGPGDVIFADPANPKTNATFSIAGDYVLRLTASDSALSSSDDVRIVAGQLNGTRSSRGNEFWLMFQESLGSVPSLFITSETDSSGNVSVPGVGFSQNFSVAAGQITSVTLPTTIFAVGSENIQNVGIHVLADHEITVYGINFEQFATDAYLGLPVTALGKEYVNASYVNVGIINGTELGVVAPYDNTTVTITPSQTTGGRLEGVPYSFILHRGRTYELRNTNVPGDLTGTIITADKPVAVFGTHQCADIRGLACNHLVEQLPSTDTWGTHFVTVPLATRKKGDTFRIIGAQDGTTVTINGQELATVNRGQFYETLITQASYIVSDHPVLVVQYSNGSTFDGTNADPFMIVVPPIEQYRAAYTVTTVQPNWFLINFINVVIPASAKSSLQLDGAPVAASAFTDIANSGFSAAQLSVGTGSHRLVSNVPFGVFVYGFANFDGYGYTGGIALAGVPGGNLALVPATSVRATNTLACAVASVTDADGNALPAVNVSFTVTGSNSQSSGVDTDNNGQARFCYTGANTGADSITASIGTSTAAATVAWQADAGNQAPQVFVQDSLNVTRPDALKLPGVVVDDGLPIGGALTQQWSKVSGPGTATFTNASTAVTSVTFSLAGDYVLQLLASDSQLSGAASVAVHVTDSTANKAPVITPLPAQSLDFSSNPNGTMTIAPAITDDGLPVGAKLSYNWSLISGGSGITIVDPTAASTPLVIKDAGGNQSFVLKLTVDDSRLSSTMNFTVNTITANRAPSVSPGPGGTITLPANTFTLNGSVTDDGKPAGSTLTIQWQMQSGPAPVTFASPNTAVTGVTFQNVPGTYVLRLSASDGQLSSSNTVQVTVNPANKAPVVSIPGVPAITLPVNVVTLNGSVTDDGLPANTLNISWAQISGPAPVVFSASNQPVTQATFSTSGSYQLQLRADDTQLQTVANVTVQVNPANKAPVVSAGPDQTIALPTTTVTLTGTVQDDGLPSGAVVTQQWSQVSGPAPVTFSAPTQKTTNATFTIDGTYVLRLTATDTKLSTSSDVTITVLATPQNLPPVVSAGLNQTVTLPSPTGIVQPFLSGSVKDDGLPVGKTVTQQWSLVSGPAAVTFSNATSLTTFVTMRVAGIYVLRLTATDTQLTSSADVTILVNPPINQPPSVSISAPSSISLPSTTATLTGTVSDDGLPNGILTLQWTQLSGPTAATISAPNSAITQVDMPLPGSYVFQLAASDSVLTTTRSVTISVVPNQAPTVSITAASTTIFLPQSASLAANVTDDGLPSHQITYQWSQFAGPAPVTFSTPTAATTQVFFTVPGNYTIQILVSDTQLTGTASIQLTVNPALPPLSVGIISPPDGAAITQPTSVTGNVSNSNTNWKLEYSLTSGNDGDTPSWVQFASGTGQQIGAVLGTFDPTALMNGTYTIRLSATDANGQSATASVVVSVEKNIKVGDLQLAFNDLTVPLPGLPIQIIRSYDSRDKRQGDFGFSWTLGLRNLRLEKNRNLGRNWTEDVTFSGGFPTYCLTPNNDRFVTVTFPDGRVYKFQAVAGPQCQRFVPITAPTLQFQQVPTGPGTFGATLSTADGEPLLIDGAVPGPQNIIDFNVNIYNPTLFRMTTAEGFTYIIDQNVGATSVTDPSGNRVTINASGITSSNGLSVAFQRDAQNRITQITDATGLNVLKYSYNASGDLATFTDEVNNVTRYNYGANHFLSSIVDARNITVFQAAFDSAGHLTSTTDGLGRQVRFTHDIPGHRETITDRLNNVTVYEYDNDGNITRVTDPLGHVTTATFDANDNKLTETNALGKTIVYSYDAANNRLSETDPLGHVNRYSYNGRHQILSVTDAAGNVSTNSYDANGNLFSSKDALGKITTYTYNAQGMPITVKDALGNTTSFVYDANGRATRQTDALGNVSTFAYDANGNKLSQTVTRTKADGTSETLTTQYQYDADNRLVKTTNSDGTSKQTVYNSIGKPSDVFDSLNRKTHYDYDNNGRLSKTTYPDLTTESSTYDANDRRLTFVDRLNRTTSFTYDALGRLTKTTYPDLSFTQTVYDAIGQTIQTIDELNHITSFAYDDAGRRTSVTDALNNATSFSYDAVGNQTSVTDALGQTMRFVYDSSNRRIQTVYPDQTSAFSTYDALGRETTKTDQSGKVTQFGYDTIGRLTTVTQFLNGSPLITTFAYDELGNRVSQTDANGHVTRFAYDQRGRRTSRTLPLGMSETYGYDAVGNMTSKKDFNGRTTTFQYDSMNQLKVKTADPFFSTGSCASGLCGATQITYNYNNMGRRVSMIDASGTTNYTYDTRDRLLTKAAPAGTLTYTYDAAGNMLSLRSSNAGGASMTYTYDQLNRLAAVTDVSGTTRYTYDAVGNLGGFVYPNGVQTSYSYNTLNRLTQMQATCATGTRCGAPGTVISSYVYTLGPAGNRLSVTELSGRTVSYGYDDVYRLTSESISGAATENGTVSYQYDRVGNRLQLNSTLSAISSSGLLNYDANDRTVPDLYDANGNLLNGSAGSNVYDFENRPVLSGTIKIVYDGDGNRVSETVAGVTTKYLVADQNLTGYAQVIDELQNSSVSRVYSYGSTLISQRLTASGAGLSFYGFDGQGSVRFLTDSSGAITDTYDYDAFGNLISQTGTTPNNYLFASEQFDPALGVYYNRARYYDERAGRFWSMDTVEGSSGDPLSLHKYIFCGSNPVACSDASGNQFLSEISIAQVVQATLIAINVFSGFTNTVHAIQDIATAYSAFARHDMWDGAYALTAAVAHAGLAALSFWGIKGINLPPPPLTGAVAVGSAGVAMMWRVAALNPAFEEWVWQTLAPVAIGTIGIMFASSMSPHEAEWELRNSDGTIRTRGTEESGGTNPGRRLTWPEQLATHTERKILEQLIGKVRPGEIITIRGQLPPCTPGCSPAMKAFAEQNGVKIMYSVEEKVWIFRPDGTIIKPD